jgi:hypothetical protein
MTSKRIYLPYIVFRRICEGVPLVSPLDDTRMTEMPFCFLISYPPVPFRRTRPLSSSFDKKRRRRVRWGDGRRHRIQGPSAPLPSPTGELRVEEAPPPDW